MQLPMVKLPAGMSAMPLGAGASSAVTRKRTLAESAAQSAPAFQVICLSAPG